MILIFIFNYLECFLFKKKNPPTAIKLIEETTTIMAIIFVLFWFEIGKMKFEAVGASDHAVNEYLVTQCKYNVLA